MPTVTRVTRTQVVIVGAGPAGLLLGQLLQREGIDTVILERRSAEYVLGRIAPVCSSKVPSTCSSAPAWPHACTPKDWCIDGVEIGFRGRRHRIALQELVGKSVTVYGQTEMTRDLMDARAAQRCAQPSTKPRT